VGEVVSVDAAQARIGLKTDAGETVTVRTGDQTTFVRARPGARDLAGAAPVSLAEIAVGDRILARGALGEDGSVAARQVVVMARADIAQKHEQDEAEWRRRGVSGVITAIDPARQEITVESRSLMGSQAVRVSTSEPTATFKRYAPDSVRFSDARPSSFAELQVGDQVRVLGDRAADGSTVTAEQVVSGSFQIVSGPVQSVQGGTVTILDNETGRPLEVAVAAETLVRRLPAEMAARLALRNRAPAEGARSGAPGGGPTRRADGGPAARPGDPPEGGAGPNGARRMGAQTLQDMLERLPPFPVAELKPGEQVAVSSSKAGAGAGRVTASVLLAGIEPLLQARPGGGAGRPETLGLAAGALDMGLEIQ
jgi:hypothetical protein